MTAKLNLDIAKGTLDVEGDPDLVREIYKDLKEQILPAFKERAGGDVREPAPALQGEAPTVSSSENKSVRRASKRKMAAGSGSSTAKSPAYKPRIDGALELANLEAFYDQYQPANNYEKILIFIEFLRSKLSVDPCSADAIYTCFDQLKSKIKIPTAFQQALVDCRGKHAFIEYDAYDSIRMTPRGQNHLLHSMKRSDDA